MARKNQILINYHTSGLTSMPLASDVELGEIVVRHADERPELLLKTNNGEFAVVPASGAVASAISGAITILEGNVNGAIADVNEAIENHVKEFNQYKEDAAAEFATKGELSGEVETLNGNINTAKGEAIAAASAYTDSAVASAKEELEGAIQDVDAKVQEANSGTSILEQYVKDTYATSADTEAAIAVAKDEAVAAASAYTDGEIAEVFVSATTVAAESLASAKEELEGAIEDVDAKVDELSGATEAFKGEVARTYATSAHTMDAINVAKNAAIGAASAYTDGEIAEVFVSATTVAAKELELAVDTLGGNIDGVDSKVNTLSSATETFKGEVARTYATSAATEAAIAKAKDEAVAAASAYTDGEIAEVFTSATTVATEAVASAKEELEGAIEDVDAKVDELSGATEAFKGEVARTYATSAATEAAIAKAKDEAVAAASAYTDGEIAEVFTSATTVAANALSTAKEEIMGEVEDIESAMNSGFTAIRGELSATTDDLTELINEKVAVAYRYKGSCEYAKLPVSGEVIGEVWNITDANGNYPAGTNYAWNGSEWDALGGSIDLSPYHKTADFNTYVTEMEGELSAIRASISDANSGTSILEQYVKDTYATSAATEAAIAKAKGEAVAAASAYTDGEIAEVFTSATTVAAEALASAKEELEGDIQDVRSELGTAIESAVSALTAEIEANELTTAAAFNKFNESAGFNENGESVLDGGKSLTQGILDAESHIVEVYASASTFATNAISSARTELEGSIADVLAVTGDNAEAIKNVKATADTAVQSYSVNCGVKASNKSTVGTFDFSEMVIDGGEF